MERRKVAVVEEVSWNSTRILGMPGANMEEPRGLEHVSKSVGRCRSENVRDKGHDGEHGNVGPFLAVGPVHGVFSIVRSVPVDNIGVSLLLVLADPFRPERVEGAIIFFP